MSTSLKNALSNINIAVARIESGNKKVVRVSQQVMLGLCLVLITAMIWFSFSLINKKSHYVAGKYGKTCYHTTPSNVTKPVNFNTLEDCLDFVAK